MVRQYRLRGWEWLLTVFACCLLGAGTSGAALLDAPHNESNRIVCGDCHAYSLWWQFAIPAADLEAGGQRANGVCRPCHQRGGSGPEKQGHDSTVLGNGHGVWNTSCVSCHDPHLQEQLGWSASNDAELFLARGTLGGVITDNRDGTSSIAYSAATSLPGWDYPAWERKNNTLPKRGLILVVDRQAASNTYPVVAASESTPGTGLLTVKGIIAPASVNNSFGLIYGMLIKNRIMAATVAAPGVTVAKEVKFFNPQTINATGGFTDSHQPRQGICQVCHLATSHWTEDGGNEGHHSGASCGSCHERRTGFMPSGVDHGLVLLGNPQCTSCHGDPAVLATHQGKCGWCHVSPAGGPPLRPGLSAGGCSACHPTYFDGHSHQHLVQESAADLAWLSPGLACSYCHGGVDRSFLDFAEIKTMHLNACATCHGSGRSEVTLAISGGQPVHCLTCHPSKGVPASHGVDHGVSVAATASCVTCHKQADRLLGIHATNRCLTCHSSTLAPVVLSGSAAGHAGGGACATCHVAIGNDYKNHLVQDHNGFIMTAGCTGCHFGNSIVTIHRNNCADCHATSGVLQGAAVNGPGNCAHCHPGLDPNNHLNEHKLTAFDSQPAGLSCVSCHAEMANVSSGHVGKSGTSGTISCASCHSSAEASVMAAIASGKAGGVVYCQDCHGGPRSAVHPYADHQASGHVASLASCRSCHAGAEVVQNIHNNNCGSCHTAQLTLRAGITAGDCSHCHFDFFGHPQIASHAGQVDAASECLLCHPGPDPVVDTHFGNCGLCHDMAAGGILVGLAASHGPGSCNNCHPNHGSSAHQYQDHLAAGYVLSVASCVSCHVGPEVVGNTHGNNCSLCHTANLTIKSGVTRGDCVHCHFTFWGHGNILDHGGQVMADPGCTGCHSGADPVLDIHGGKCGLCHDLGAGGILIGNAALHGPGTCGNCHPTRTNSHENDHDMTAYDLLPATLNCGGCHPEKSNINSGHRGRIGASGPISCDSCHQAAGYAAAVVAGKGGGTVYCLDCHGQRPDNHPMDLMVDHNTLILATDSCVTCHTNAERGPGIHAPGCSTCHDPNTYALIGSAAGHAGASACAVCHPTRAQDYRNHQPPTHATLTRMPECAGCHPGTDIVVEVHQGLCRHCHADVTGVLPAGGGAGAVDCLQCHPTVTSDNPHVAEHDVALFDNSPTLEFACTYCHQANVVDEHLYRQGSSGPITCYTCHTGIFYPYQGLIDLGRAGVKVYCQQCHGYRSPLHPAL